MNTNNDLIIEGLLKEYSNDEIQNFELLHNLIPLKNESSKYKSFVYMDIKNWLNLYLSSIKNKKYSYDNIIYEKIIEKIELVSLEEQIKLLKYFIRLLKKDFFIDEVDLYENLKNKLEIEKAKNANFIRYTIKKSTQNITNVLITLLLSLLVISILWCILESKYFHIISVETINFVQCNLVNYPLNLLNMLFNQADLKIDTTFELIFFILIKLYFFILITYFVIKEIGKKVESI